MASSVSNAAAIVVARAHRGWGGPLGSGRRRSPERARFCPRRRFLFARLLGVFRRSSAGLPARHPARTPRALVVSELVVALEAGAPLRDALAGALGEPELDVLYWVDSERGLGGAGWVDPQGRAAADPTESERRSRSSAQRRPRGRHRLRPVARRRAGARRGGHRAAALALQNDRLQAELRAEVRFVEHRHEHGAEPAREHRDRRPRSQHQHRRARSDRPDEEELARGEHYWTFSSSRASATG